MRILFSFIGGSGHFFPLVPVAEAAARVGHVVAFAGSGGQQSTITSAGFTAYATSDPPAPRPPAPARTAGPPDVTDAREAELEFAENFAARGAARHASVLPTIIDDFAPDLVVRDEAALGSALAAELRGIPSVCVLVLAAGTLIRPGLVEPRVRDVRRQVGLPAEPPAERRELVLSPFPSSLRAPDARPAHVDIAFRSGAPVGVREPTGRPSIYVTLGTVFGAESGDLLDRLLLGVADVDADVLVAVGSHLEPAELGVQPAHVRIERFVDQDAVLARTDLVVSHGGSGTLLGSLAHGLPQVLVPLGADQPHNAERALALGFGRVVDAARATPTEIRRAVEDTLADPDVRTGARELQQQINELPHVDAAVRVVEQLV